MLQRGLSCSMLLRLCRRQARHTPSENLCYMRHLALASPHRRRPQPFSWPAWSRKPRPRPLRPLRAGRGLPSHPPVAPRLQAGSWCEYKKTTSLQP